MVQRKLPRFVSATASSGTVNACGRFISFAPGACSGFFHLALVKGQFWSMEVQPTRVSVLVWSPLGKTITSTTFRLGDSHELGQVFDFEPVWYLSQWFGGGQSGSHLVSLARTSTVPCTFTRRRPLFSPDASIDFDPEASCRNPIDSIAVLGCKLFSCHVPFGVTITCRAWCTCRAWNNTLVF